MPQQAQHVSAAFRCMRFWLRTCNFTVGLGGLQALSCCCYADLDGCACTSADQHLPF
jgi:hypothetical protein